MEPLLERAFPMMFSFSFHFCHISSAFSPLFPFPFGDALYNDPVTGVFTNRNEFFYFICSRPEETLNGAGGSEKQAVSVEMTTLYYIYKVCLQMSWKILSVLWERNF